MKVKQVEAIPIAYPEPNDDNSTRHLLLVRLTGDDGQTGWGEAVTMWPEATLGTKAVVEGLAPIVLERDPLERRSIWTDIKSTPGGTAKAASPASPSLPLTWRCGTSPAKPPGPVCLTCLAAPYTTDCPPWSVATPRAVT